MEQFAERDAQPDSSSRVFSRSPSVARGITRRSIPAALTAAIELAADPAKARIMMGLHLPPDVFVLIRIAAGCPETLARSAAATNRHPDFLHAATIRYIEKVLWAPKNDHYRALGVAPNARRREIAQHLLWLAKWVAVEWGWEELEGYFSTKILPAWNALKSPELRNRYDHRLFIVPQLPPAISRRAKRREDEDRIAWRAPPLPRPDAGGRWQLLAVAASVAAVLAIATVDWIAFHPSAHAEVRVKTETIVTHKLRDRLPIER